MRSRLFAVLAAGFGLLLATVPALAHHSFAAEFDSEKPVSMKGKFVRMEWINPHSWIYMEVTGADGNAIDVANTPTFAGGISNSGTIAAINDGILVSAVTVFAGGISNSGTIIGAAYGIAVTGVMVISTMLASIVALRRWKWRPGVVGPVFGLLALVDLAFLIEISRESIQMIP